MDIQDLTQSPLDKDGVFRAFPIAWTVEKSTKEESESVAIAFRFGIAQAWHGKEAGWSEAWPPGYFVENRTWIVKKDGTLNQPAIDNLAKCGLWNGDFDALAGPCPTGFFVHVDVGSETFDGKLRHRANWINPDADEPAARGGFQPADASLLSSLRTRFQSQTRAIAGGGARGPAAAPPHAPAPVPAMQARPAILGTPETPAPARRAAPGAAPRAPGAANAAPGTTPRGPRPAIPNAAPAPAHRAQAPVPEATGGADDPIQIDDSEVPF